MTQHLNTRPVTTAETSEILEIINAAATAYKGHIPEDCWHEPYMDQAELEAELAAGVKFIGCDIEGELAAVMGVQPVKNVHLIRHAYVAPASQGLGLGGSLLDYLCESISGPILVGTWRAATWAIRFYRRHGFNLTSDASIPHLLRTYWSISDRQIETSVVLTRPQLDEAGIRAMIANANHLSESG